MLGSNLTQQEQECFGMNLFSESNIAGPCNGWDGDTFFRLDNGQIWEQAVIRCKHFYRFRPQVKVWDNQGQYLLQVEGESELLPVRRVK